MLALLVSMITCVISLGQIYVWLGNAAARATHLYDSAILKVGYVSFVCTLRFGVCIGHNKYYSFVFSLSFLILIFAHPGDAPSVNGGMGWVSMRVGPPLF